VDTVREYALQIIQEARAAQRDRFLSALSSCNVW
jgi:hypothetical protein